MRKTVVAVLSVLSIIGCAVLAIPQAGPALAVAPSEGSSQSSQTYVVQSGDCLFSIAARFGARVEDLSQANNLSNPDYLFVGQQLIVPATVNNVAGSTQTTVAGQQAMSASQLTDETPNLVMTARSASLLALLNEQRVAGGLQPLSFQPKLLSTAQYRSDDMATRNYFSHTTPEGGTVHDLLYANGINYAVSNEILARNNYPDDQSASVAATSFMNSPAHRSHIMSKAYNQAAVAEARSANGIRYFTVVLASAQ